MELKKINIKNATQWLSNAWQIFKRKPIWFLALANLCLLLQFLANYYIPWVGGIVGSFAGISLAILVVLSADLLDRQADWHMGLVMVQWRKTLNQQLVFGLVIWMLFLMVGIISAVVFIYSLGGFEQFHDFVLNMAAAMDDQDEMNALILPILPKLGIFFLIPLFLTIPLMMMYWFAPSLIALEGMPVINAMKSSFILCVKNIWPFTWLSVLLFFWLVVACIPIFLGLLVFNSVWMIIMYTSYVSFASKSHEPHHAIETELNTVDDSV